MTSNVSGIGQDILAEIIKYFIIQSVPHVLENLRKFGVTLQPDGKVEIPEDFKFPSVCLLGLGRCGSNIALGVSNLVYQARLNLRAPIDIKATITDTSKDNSTERSHVGTLKDNSKMGEAWAWVLKFFGRRDKAPVYLVEPVVLVGDLDIDIAGRIKTSEYKEIIKVRYEKLKILDLSEVHHGGAGNVPIIGQYLAKIILNSDTSSFKDPNWNYYHSYLIDSPGLKENQSRLYFFIFSAGGGTGSGMAGEFGLAQQYAYYQKKIHDGPVQVDNVDDSSKTTPSRGLEQIFSSGIAILPHFNPSGGEDSQAVHVNAGRLICKYLAEDWRQSQSDPGVDIKAGRGFTIKPWNVLMLISNNIMRFVEQSQDAQSVDVTQMEKNANQYVSQQIFNILSAQALTSDYDEMYFKNADIDIGDTIRLDPHDLHISLSGPVAIAYAESKIPQKSGDDFDLPEVLYRSISLPAFNNDTQAIEGISILPQSVDDYKESLKKFKDNQYRRLGLEHVKFFANCSATVTIISIPKDYKLPWSELNKLKVALDNIFPHTKLKRYALIIGASSYLSLTTVIAKSPCLCDEVLTLLYAYLKRCFAKEEFKRNTTLEEAIKTYLIEKEQDESKLREILNISEDASEIMEANWAEVKWSCERKYNEFIPAPEKYIPIDNIRLTINDVLDALRFVYKVLRHKGVPLGIPRVDSWEPK